MLIRGRPIDVDNWLLRAGLLGTVVMVALTVMTFSGWVVIGWIAVSAVQWWLIMRQIEVIERWERIP